MLFFFAHDLSLRGLIVTPKMFSETDADGSTSIYLIQILKQCLVTNTYLNKENYLI